jgi:hypothetical protein
MKDNNKIRQKRDKFTTVRRKKGERRKTSAGLHIYFLHKASVLS